MAPRVLKMAKEDAPEVYRLGNATPEFHTGTDTPDFYSLATLEKWIRHENGVTLAAKESETLLGFVLAHAMPGSNDGYINCLATKPEARGQGVGDMLLKECVRQLGELGCNHTFAAVSEENKAMLSLMRKSGFAVGESFRYVETMLKEPTASSSEESV